jgi:hypothetical protein
MAKQPARRQLATIVASTNIDRCLNRLFPCLIIVSHQTGEINGQNDEKILRIAGKFVVKLSKTKAIMSKLDERLILYLLLFPAMMCSIS